MERRFWFLEPRLRVAVLLWAALAAALCVKAIPEGCEHSIYPVYAGGVRHWWNDRPLYVDYKPTENIDYFRYSPTFAVAFTPLAVLPNPFGEAAWALLSVGLLLYALHVSMRDVFSTFLWGGDDGFPCDEDRRLRDEGVFLALSLAVSGIGLWSGQSNALVLSFLLLGLAAMVRRRWWTAAAWLASAVFVKLWPVALVLLLVVFWPRRLTLRFAAICAALAAVPFLTRPPGTVLWQYDGWWFALTHPGHVRWPGFRDAWTIWEQVAPLFGARADPVAQHRAYLFLQAASALAVFSWCALQWLGERKRGAVAGVPSEANDVGRGPHGRLLMSIFSIWAAWQLLFGPASEQLTYGLIAPTAAWAVLTSFHEKRGRVLTVAILIGLTLLSAGDIERALCRVFPFGKALLPLCVVALVGWLIWHERNRRAIPQPFSTGQ